MSTLGYIILFTFLGSVVALLGGFLLIFKEKFALGASHFLSSFAAGVLLSAAFLDLLPEATREVEHLAEEGIIFPENSVFIFALFGLVLFFLLERFIHWFHHHEEYHAHGEEAKTTVPLIVLSDTAHNFIDGIIIGATFLVSPPLGITTALAVFAHELPQEIGDFALLLHKGVKRGRVILINLLSASAAFLGALLAYFLGENIEFLIPFFFAVTAGFFIYIAASDLIPEIHHEKRKGFAFYETVLFFLGIGVLYLTVSLIPNGH